MSLVDGQIDRALERQARTVGKDREDQSAVALGEALFSYSGPVEPPEAAGERRKATRTTREEQNGHDG